MIPKVEVGNWVIVTEDGVWASMGGWSYPTKKLALDDISCAYLDERPTPKVKRVDKGYYWYYPKQDGRFLSFITIKLITEKNVNKVNEMIKEQWESDPLSKYDE